MEAERVGVGAQGQAQDWVGYATQRGQAPAHGRGESGAAPSVRQSSRLDSLPLPPPRQARYRRMRPNEHVLDITLGEYFTRLRRLAVLAQERGRAKRNGRFPRRTPMEIELALGRGADDRGIATLFKELFGEGVGESAAEIAELLSGLMGTAKHFGTAIGSKAALAAEATRRGRKRVIAALRTKASRQRGATGSAEGVATPARTGDRSNARGDPARPRAG